MQVRVGITTDDLTGLDHKRIKITCSERFRVMEYSISSSKGTPPRKLCDVPAWQSVEIVHQNNVPKLIALGQEKTVSMESLLLQLICEKGHWIVQSLKRPGAKSSEHPRYIGTLSVVPRKNALGLVLQCDLEHYIAGVLQSEIPASYHLEAIKAQAIAARTYGLRPRIDHTRDYCNVCDSYLCCQYFAGKQTISARHKEAIEATKGMILTYQDRPILALFSSCAGGHTESYQNCFSDPKTNQFPPDPLPYLTGVPEGKLPCPMSEGEKALKALWHQAKPDTADAWSPHFKWKVDMSADAIEAHMHHVVETMMNDKDKAPFIVPPSSAKFGHVEGFEVAKRGVSGTAIELHIKTRSGIWTIKKELVIRDVFRNDETRLKRLKSAKIFFAHYKDRLGLLSNLTIYGLGWGHGVGLQQTGSQGFAKRGLKANQILQHYFPGAVPENSSS